MKKQNKNIAAGVGVAAAVAAAAAAGAYFLYGKDGAKNRKKVKGWMLKAKGEVLEKLEEAKVMSEPVYNKIVSEVTAKYKDLKNVDKAEVMAMAKDLKKHWKSISKHMRAKKPAKASSKKRQ